MWPANPMSPYRAPRNRILDPVAWGSCAASSRYLAICPSPLLWGVEVMGNVNGEGSRFRFPLALDASCAVKHVFYTSGRLRVRKNFPVL